MALVFVSITCPLTFTCNQYLYSFADGELYAGITSDFLSRDSAFFRSLGARHVIRTEQYDPTWLQGTNTLFQTKTEFRIHKATQ